MLADGETTTTRGRRGLVGSISAGWPGPSGWSATANRDSGSSIRVTSMDSRSASSGWRPSIAPMLRLCSLGRDRSLSLNPGSLRRDRRLRALREARHHGRRPRVVGASLLSDSSRSVGRLSAAELRLRRARPDGPFIRAGNDGLQSHFMAALLGWSGSGGPLSFGYSRSRNGPISNTAKDSRSDAICGITRRSHSPMAAYLDPLLCRTNVTHKPRRTSGSPTGCSMSG